MSDIPTGTQEQWNVQNAESRTNQYKEWRMNLRAGSVQDVDQFEYNNRNGVMVPIAIVEVTKVEGVVRNPTAYLQTVKANRHRQMWVASYLSKLLVIPAWYIVFQDNFSQMWKMNLSSSKNPFEETTIGEWGDYIKALHNVKA